MLRIVSTAEIPLYVVVMLWIVSAVEILLLVVMLWIVSAAKISLLVVIMLWIVSTAKISLLVVVTLWIVSTAKIPLRVVVMLWIVSTAKISLLVVVMLWIVSATEIRQRPLRLVRASYAYMRANELASTRRLMKRPTGHNMEEPIWSSSAQPVGGLWKWYSQFDGCLFWNDSFSAKIEQFFYCRLFQYSQTKHEAK